MLLPKYRRPKEPKFDRKAGKQIFTTPNKHKTIVVLKDTTNPIDIRLRQLALTIDGRIDVTQEFLNKWVCLEQNHTLYTGRIKDLYFETRHIRILTRGKEIVIGSFDSVIELGEKEL